MPKRKRDGSVEEGGDGAGPSENGGIKQKRVAYKLQQGTKKVAHAFKLAKGFERQKLSRRRKAAVSQQKSQDVQRIDAEVVALKALDHGTAAQQHVYKSLLKIKAVAEHPDLPEEVRKPSAKSTDAPTLNVIARICKSNQAKEALAPVLAEVQNALGLDGGAVRKKRKRAKDSEKTERASKAVKPAPAEKKLDRREEPEDTGSDVDEDEFTGHDDRIAMSGSEGELSDGDQSVGEIERQLEAEGIRPKTAKSTPTSYNHEADLSISESESNRGSPESPEPRKAAAPTKRSAFLPALTMGGYISGSGSDIDDDIDAAPKKNRRGQRARQQLWEKKFGQRAKHLQGSGKENEGRKAGWDAKRGATDGSERRGKSFGGGRPVRREGAGVDRVEKKKKDHRDDGGPIHPSWEAAKRAKERKEVPVAFQGKKITFD